jgi:hypothetical protein
MVAKCSVTSCRGGWHNGLQKRKLRRCRATLELAQLPTLITYYGSLGARSIRRLAASHQSE